MIVHTGGLAASEHSLLLAKQKSPEEDVQRPVAPHLHAALLIVLPSVSVQTGPGAQKFVDASQNNPVPVVQVPVAPHKQLCEFAMVPSVLAQSRVLERKQITWLLS